MLLGYDAPCYTKNQCLVSMVLVYQKVKVCWGSYKLKQASLNLHHLACVGLPFVVWKQWQADLCRKFAALTCVVVWMKWKQFACGEWRMLCCLSSLSDVVLQNDVYQFVREHLGVALFKSWTIQSHLFVQTLFPIVQRSITWLFLGIGFWCMMHCDVQNTCTINLPNLVELEAVTPSTRICEAVVLRETKMVSASWNEGCKEWEW